MNQTIGTRIGRLRRNKDITQEAMAEMLKVSPQAVSKWANDRAWPDISVLPQLANLLGVTVDGLLSGETFQAPVTQYLPEEQRKNLNEMLFRVVVNTDEGDKVRVNLPMPLVKIAVETGMVMPQVADIDVFKSIDFEQIFEMVESGLIGKLVEVETVDGVSIEIVVE